MTAQQQQPQPQRIPIRAYRSAARLTVVSPMPGVEPEDITVEVTADGTLTLRGALRGQFKDVKELLVDEWTIGAYERAVALPVHVDGTLANVTYDNGVLTVVLPIVEQTRAAHLTLESVGRARGERVGSHGRDIEPTSTAAHQAVKQQQGSGHES